MKKIEGEKERERERDGKKRVGRVETYRDQIIFEDKNGQGRRK